MSARQIEVLVADDESDVRLLLSVQLDLEHDLRVVGAVSDGAEAIDFCRAQEPDVVVMDLLMPRMSGLDAIAQLRAECRGIAIVAYTAVAGDFVREQMAAQGVPVVLKSGDPSPLLDAIRRAARSPGA